MTKILSLEPAIDPAVANGPGEPDGPSLVADPPAIADDERSWRLRPLYADFYALVEAPFDLTPNPKFMFLSGRQREALSNLRYALAASKGFTLILGEAGTGKTTLVRAALGELGGTASRYVLITNPTLGRDEFYEFLAQAFELSAEAGASKTRFLAELQESVTSRFAKGGLTGLVVDEAQSMPRELLEEIRLLGNIETSATKLLNIVLSGQPELADRLNDVSLRQLKPRIAFRCELRALTLRETAAYVSGRLRIAGGSPAEIFTREAVETIHEASRGIPRTLNVLCDNTLLNGFAAGLKPIPVDLVREVCRDLDLDAPPALHQPAPARSLEVAPTAPNANGSNERPLFGSLRTARKSRFPFWVDHDFNTCSRRAACAAIGSRGEHP